MNKDNIEILSKAFLDETTLWKGTSGKKELTKVMDFLDTVSEYNILIFNTVASNVEMKKVLTKDEDTQNSVLTFLTRVRFRFLSYGGDWDVFIDMLKDISGGISEDTLLDNSGEGYTQSLPLTEKSILQALVFFYILSPNLIITARN